MIHSGFQVDALPSSIWGWGQRCGRGWSQDACVCSREGPHYLNSWRLDGSKHANTAPPGRHQQHSPCWQTRTYCFRFCLFSSESWVTRHNVSFLCPNRSLWSKPTLSAASLSWWPRLSPPWSGGRGQSLASRRDYKEGSPCPTRTWVWNLQMVPNTLWNTFPLWVLQVWFGFLFILFFLSALLAQAIF